MSDSEEIRLGHVYPVYGYLLSRCMQAHRDDDPELGSRILAAIEIFEELYPEETALFKADYSPKGDA